MLGSMQAVSIYEAVDMLVQYKPAGRDWFRVYCEVGRWRHKMNIMNI
jgi:hypothetical protein